MKKRIISWLLVMALVLSMAPVVTIEAEAIEEITGMQQNTEASSAPVSVSNEAYTATASGTCGTGVYWEYFEDTQTLYIHGHGSITSSPWSKFGPSIKKIVVGNEITGICSGAFGACSSVEEITTPFIGESGNVVVGASGVLGHFFDSEEVYVNDIVCEQDGYGYSFSTVTIKSSFGLESNSTYREYRESNCTNAALELLQGDKGSFVLATSGSSRVFKNCYWHSSYRQIPSSSYTWQYSCNDFYNNFGMMYHSTSSYASSIHHYGYYMRSYYYNIPSTLHTVNITAQTSIPVAAFNGCANIETINYYSPITSEGNYCYQNCNAAVNHLYTAHSEINTYSNGIDTFTYSVQNGNATILGCETTNTAINIPSAVDGYPVKAIGYKAFANNTELKSVLLPTNIAQIDNYAFYNCTNLENVTLGTSLVEIGDCAFYNTALTKVTTPASLRTIGDYAFANCTKLEKFAMRSGVESIGDGVFYNDSLLSDVTISDTLATISDFAFYNCTALTEISIPASVIRIENCVFENCSSLAVATVAGDVEYIGKKAFYSCKLSNFNFGSKLTYLGADSFSSNPIASVDLPNTVTQIGEQAFSDCQLLNNVYTPDSVTIGANAFSNNASNIKVTIRCNTGSIANEMLRKNKVNLLTIESGITEIGEYAFAECTNLVGISLPDTLKKIGNYAFYNSKLAQRVSLPSSITEIGNYAFAGAELLSIIRVPDSVWTIGQSAFDQKVSVEVYYHYGEIEADCFAGQNVTGITVADHIFGIGDGAFAGCGNLTAVSLPDTIMYFGDDCFLNTPNVTLTVRTVDGLIDDEIYKGKLANVVSVVLDNSSIGKYTFAENASLEKVTITGVSNAATMQTIREHAFAGCASLCEINIPATVTDIGAYAFYDCAALKAIHIPDGVTAVQAYSFYNCAALTDINLPATVASIGEYAFYGCTGLESVNISNGVETIPAYAFYGCSALRAINIVDSVRSIEEHAFHGCIELKNVKMSNQCQTIGDYAFYNCSKIIVITIPESVKEIGKYAFASCSSIEEIILSDYVEAIGESAFYNCTSLRLAQIGQQVTALNSQVFGGCYMLESVYIYAQLTFIDDFAFYGAENVTAYIGADSYMIQYFEDNWIDYVILDDFVYEYVVIFKDLETGEVYKQEYLPYGSAIIAPESPTKDGYVFVGWQGYQLGMTVGENIEFAAIWHEHLFGGWYVVLEPNCLYPGQERRDCTACDYCELRNITVVDHHYQGIITEPACTQQGYTTYTCSVCGDSYVADYVDALGHDYGSVVTEPTYTEQGYTTHTCTRCGESYVDSYTGPLVPETDVKVIIGTVTGMAGDTLEVYLTLENAPELKILAISDLVYDTEHLTLVSGEWLPEGSMLSSWNPVTLKGVHAFGENTDLNGDVFKLTFTINEDAPAGVYEICCQVTAKQRLENGSEVEVPMVTESGAVEVIEYTPGDVDGNEFVTTDDAIYLLYHIMFGEEDYAVNQNCDFDGKGFVTTDDAIYLLYHIMFGETDYPLH